MHVGDKNRPPLSPQEGWITDGRQVLHFKPLRYDRWSQLEWHRQSLLALLLIATAPLQGQSRQS